MIELVPTMIELVPTMIELVPAMIERIPTPQQTKMYLVVELNFTHPYL